MRLQIHLVIEVRDLELADVMPNQHYRHDERDTAQAIIFDQGCQLGPIIAVQPFTEIAEIKNPALCMTTSVGLLQVK